MIPTPPPPPQPRLLDQGNIPRPSISNTKKCKNVFVALLIVGTMWALIVAALYLAFSCYGNRDTVSGSGGSTPAKVMNKFMYRIKKPLQVKPVIQYDALAVRDGAQKVAVDRKVHWFGPRASKGTELGSINGQNPRQRVTSSNGNDNSSMFLNYTNGNHQQRPPLVVQQNGMKANGHKRINFNNTSKTAP